MNTIATGPATSQAALLPPRLPRQAAMLLALRRTEQLCYRPGYPTSGYATLPSTLTNSYATYSIQGRG